MHKLAEQQEFERANEIKRRIKSLDLLHQEQSFNSSLTSVDFFHVFLSLIEPVYVFCQ